MEIGRLIETERLVIREILDEDKGALVEMASDGSWNDVGFDAKCQTWIEEWIQEARSLSKENNPRNGYLAYGVVLKETEKIIGMVGCSYYRDLDRKLYQDVNDEKEELYRFYVFK